MRRSPDKRVAQRAHLCSVWLLESEVVLVLELLLPLELLLVGGETHVLAFAGVRVRARGRVQILEALDVL